MVVLSAHCFPERSKEPMHFPVLIRRPGLSIAVTARLLIL
jgi:hypothetical protein